MFKPFVFGRFALQLFGRCISFCNRCGRFGNKCNIKRKDGITGIPLVCRYPPRLKRGVYGPEFVTHLYLCSNFKIYLLEYRCKRSATTPSLQTRGRVATRHCYSVRSLCGTATWHCYSVSGQCNGVSVQCNGVSGHCNNVSRQCNGVSLQCNGVSGHCMTVSV